MSLQLLLIALVDLARRGPVGVFAAHGAPLGATDTRHQVLLHCLVLDLQQTLAARVDTPKK